MNQTLKTIQSLRSIHGNFSQRDVSEEDLQTILNASVRAATASAMQNYSIIVVNDRDVIKEHLAYPGSKALIYCVDFNRHYDVSGHLNMKYNLEGIQDFITGSTDTILAAQTAAIAAKSLDIDSLFTNSLHRCDLDKFYSTFNLPEKHCFPLISLLLGYPDSEPEYQKGRLQAEGVIHYGQYRRAEKKDMEKIVSMHDNADSHMAMMNNWTDLGFDHYLNWFYAKWCGDGDDRIDEQKKIFSTLARAGFVDDRLWTDKK